ncbi:MAG: multidrug effflux MFS transporter [Burkholderiales bacterium]
MPRHHPTSMPAGLIVLILAMLMGLQPVTTDLYLPALPGLTRELGASMPQAQLTLTALLLAFGISQLIWGPLSDRFGRRPILLAGMVAYVVASLASAFSPSMEQLILWRAVQGAAMGAGVMCARAIVRDLYTPAQGANVMSKALSGLGVVACLSPPIGGLLTALASWHAALLALSVFGALCLGLIALRFDETVPRKNPRALQPRTLAHTWLGIIRNPTFLAFSLLTVCSYSGLFTFLAASSFVMIRVYGFSTTEYGVLMFFNAFTYLAGTFLCRRWLLRFGVRRTLVFAGALTFGGGTLMGVLALAQVQSPWAILLPFAPFMLAHGVHNPCAQSGAVGPFPHAAGAASALNGFLTMLSAFATGQWLGTHMDGTAAPLIFGIWFWSVLIALIAWTLVQRYGRP